MSSATITVEDYKPLWCEHFTAIKRTLSSHLSSISVISIEHVGSTSVPGLAATPIIDVDIIVERENLQITIDCLVSNGFTYLGERGIEDCHALRDPDQEPRRNIYVCIAGCAQLRNHLGVRDTLREKIELREEYGRMKMELAKQGINTIDYVEAKSCALQKILRRAGLFSNFELLDIQALNKAGEIFGVVKTGREGLVLREFILADEEAYLQLESIEEVVRYQTFEPRTKEQARSLVAEIVRNSSANPRAHIELAAEYQGKFIGRVGAKISNLLPAEMASSSPMVRSIPHADLWFSFMPSYQGKGFATESMRIFISLLKVPVELEIECDPKNLGTMKMAERLNFQKFSEEEDAFECKGVWVGSAVFRKVIKLG